MLAATTTPALSLSHDYEEEDDENEDPHAALVDTVRHSAGEDRQALAYLLRYESMVRQQEASDMATLNHIRPCIERLLELANLPIIQDIGNDDDDDKLWKSSISFQDLQKAVDACAPQEFMATDRQWQMVLRMLTNKRGTANNEITWAEVVQAYKTCIEGMITLGHLQGPDRQRARDRTICLLSLFEPPSTKLFQETVENRAPPQRKSRKSSLVVRGLLLILLGVLVMAMLTTTHVNHEWDLPVLTKGTHFWTTTSSSTPILSTAKETIVPQEPPTVYPAEWSQHPSVRQQKVLSTVGGAIGVMVAVSPLHALCLAVGWASVGAHVAQWIERH